MFSSSPMRHRNSIITRGGMRMMMTEKLLFQPQNFPFLSPSSLLHQSLRTYYKTTNAALAKHQETSEQRIARKLQSIAKEEIIHQSDSANFDNIINELKSSCCGTADEKKQLAPSPSTSSSFTSLLKLELPRFSDEVRIETPPPVVLYDKYPLGDLLRYWFLYSKPYSHLGRGLPGINNFFRLVTRGKICPLFDDLGERHSENRFALYRMERIADEAYSKVTVRDLAASKVSEAVPLRAFTLFDAFKNVLTTEHSAQIAQKDHLVPPGGLTNDSSLIRTYHEHWKTPDMCRYVFIVNGTAGSGKTIAALQMAHHRPKLIFLENNRERFLGSEEKDIVIYVNVEDVYVRGKPWKEFGKAHLEKLYRQHVLNGKRYYWESDYADFLEKALVETFDRLLPPTLFKEDFNTEYRVVIVLDGMDRNFALSLQSSAARKIVKTIQEKFFGPLPIASTRNSDRDRIFRVSFIVNAPTLDQLPREWYLPFSTTLDLLHDGEIVLPFTSTDTAECFIDKTVIGDFSNLKEQMKEAIKTDKTVAENLNLANALCSNARCAALLFSALNEQLLEAKKRKSAKSMKSLDKPLKSIFPQVVREYTKRCGLSMFQHPEKALLVALAVSIFDVPILPRTLQHCPLLRKSLQLVGEKDDDGDDSHKSLYDLLVEDTRLLLDCCRRRDFRFEFEISPAHLAMIHILFGIPFSAEKIRDKHTSEKCLLISFASPYFAEMKRALFLEQFDYEVGVGQSVAECLNAVRKKEKDENIGEKELMRWKSEEIAVKEALVFDSIELRGKPSDIFFFKNDLCMATEDINDEEFEQRFKQLEMELTNKSSNSSQRNSYPIFILSTAEDDTFPQVAVVGPGKVVLAHVQKSTYLGIKAKVVKADDEVNHDDEKCLENLLSSCLGKGSSSNDKDESKEQRRSSTGAQIRYLKALQGIAKKLVL